MEIVIISCVALFLSYANGGNDNLKGVATLFGSGVTNYKGALFWATTMTLAGSLCSLFISKALIAAFSGKGLLPIELIQQPETVAAVVGGAAVCVFVATKIGMPISTTHSLIGGLVGVGLTSSFFFETGDVSWSRLGEKFMIPLLLSPVLSIGMAWILYKFSSPSKPTPLGVTTLQGGLGLPNLTTFDPTKRLHLINGAHFLSSGAVSFARGLNDTPKIAAALLIGGALSPTMGLTMVAVIMAFGGIFHGSKIAETMGKKVTPISPGEGLRTNLITAFLVLWASRLGVPVSTTHVSCGALFGLSLSKKEGDFQKIRQIVGAWITTLPVAAVLSSLLFIVFKELS